jgi:hypothetical protein
MSKGFPKITKFIPLNPKKYLGDYKNILMRSSWELNYAKKLDNDPRVKFWNSEEICIPYIITTEVNGKRQLLDKKPHRYYPDFYVETIKGEKFLIEIKPYSQTHKPRNSAKKTQRTLLNEHLTYAKNESKWLAAEEFAKRNNMKFIILTERDL